MDSMSRVRSAARRVAAMRNADSYVDDLCQEVASMQLQRPVRLDRRGLTWVLHGILDKWLGRRSALTVEAVAATLGWRPAPQHSLAELRDVWEHATGAQKDAIVSLLEHGSYRRGLALSERMRSSQALYQLRKRMVG